MKVRRITNGGEVIGGRGEREVRRGVKKGGRINRMGRVRRVRAVRRPGGTPDED